MPNYDQYKTGEHDSQSPMNREQLPPEPTLIEQLQIEVDELNGKLRDTVALKDFILHKNIDLQKQIEQAKSAIEQIRKIVPVLKKNKVT